MGSYDDDYVVAVITPARGAFDLARVERFLLALPFTSKVGGLVLVADSFEEEAVADRSRKLILELRADEIRVLTRSASTAPASELVRWLSASGEVRVRGELDPSPRAPARRRRVVPDHAPVGTTIVTPTSSFVVTERLRGTSDRGVFAGYEPDHDRDVLVTVGARLRDDAPEMAALRTPGIARLRHVGALAEGHAVLIEDEPPGLPIGPRRLPLAEAVTYTCQLLRILDRVDQPLGGLAAELVYAEGGAVTEIAPRGQRLLSAGEPFCHGVPQLFTTAYFAPEIIAGGPFEAAADVFAAGVILACWLTGEHPFEGEFDRRLFSIMSHTRRPWTGPPELEAVLARALAPLRTDRPEPFELAADLEDALAAVELSGSEAGARA